MKGGPRGRPFALLAPGLPGANRPATLPCRPPERKGVMTEASQQPAPRLSVAVAGSSGLIGSELCRRLETEGHAVLRLVRHEPRGGEARWDPDAGAIDAAALEGLDAAGGLAGGNIGERGTNERKRRIRASRVEGTQLLAKTLAGLARPPRVFVSASAVGYYGQDRGDELLDEGSAP